LIPSSCIHFRAILFSSRALGESSLLARSVHSGRLQPDFSRSPENEHFWLTGLYVLVYTFRTLCVCLQRKVLRTLQQRQRNDRKADFRCGANPQRGESPWAFRQKIYKPSPASWPPSTSDIASNSGEEVLHLPVPTLRAVLARR